MERREGSDLPGGPGLRLGVAPDAVTPSPRRRCRIRSRVKVTGPPSAGTMALASSRASGSPPAGAAPIPPPRKGAGPAGGGDDAPPLGRVGRPPRGAQPLGPPPPHHRLEFVDLHAFRRRVVWLGLEGLAHRLLDPRVERH